MVLNPEHNEISQHLALSRWDTNHPFVQLNYAVYMTCQLVTL